MAHPLDFAEEEPEQVKIERVIAGLQGILRACADAKSTVRRVVYTSSISAACFTSSEIIHENSWTDVEFVRSLRAFGGQYFVTKTLAEKAAFALAEELGLDLVSVLPTWITGPFICPNIPDTVYVSMALIFGIHFTSKTTYIKNYIYFFKNYNQQNTNLIFPSYFVKKKTLDCT